MNSNQTTTYLIEEEILASFEAEWMTPCAASVLATQVRKASYVAPAPVAGNISAGHVIALERAYKSLEIICGGSCMLAKPMQTVRDNPCRGCPFVAGPLCELRGITADVRTALGIRRD